MGTLLLSNALEHLQVVRMLPLLNDDAGLLSVHLLPATCTVCPRRVLQVRLHAFEGCYRKFGTLLSFHAG